MSGLRLLTFDLQTFDFRSECGGGRRRSEVGSRRSLTAGGETVLSGPDIGCHFGKERFRSEYVNTV